MPQQATSARPSRQIDHAFPPDPYANDPWSWAFVLFRHVPDFPGYGVDTDGLVWCCRGRGGRRGEIGIEWRPLRKKLNRHGYERVFLYKGGQRREKVVHRLILETFVGDCPDGMQACHNPDYRRTNNRLRNLRWDTLSANQQDCVKHGRRINGRRPFGSGHPQARLSEIDIPVIFRMFNEGMGLRAIGRHFLVSHNTIGSIIHGRIWKHVGEKQ